MHLLRDAMRKGQQGMKDFDHALFELYQAGEINHEEAIHYADSANEVRLMIKLGKGMTPDLAFATKDMTLEGESEAGVMVGSRKRKRSSEMF